MKRKIPRKTEKRYRVFKHNRRREDIGETGSVAGAEAVYCGLLTSLCTVKVIVSNAGAAAEQLIIGGGRYTRVRL